jgi:hypothetical protein
MTGRLICCFAITAILAVATGTAPSAAQEPVVTEDMLPPVDSIAPEAPLPRAAFVRSMILPGWGHFSIGEHRRGAVYATLQTTSWLMLAKTMNRLGDARDIERALAAAGSDSLRLLMAADTAVARQLEDPAAFERALAQHPGLADAGSLVRSRQRHRQDWIVYTIVTTFASAIDAYVTAHLSDFPREIAARPTADGGLALSVRLPLGFGR